MARMPLTEKEVAASRIGLSVKSVGLTPEQFFRLCSDNPDLRLELTAQKEIIIMPPAGLKTSWRNGIICTELTTWARKDGTGIALDATGGYTLPNEAVRGPDASWIRRERWDALSDEEKEKFAEIYPDFAIELMSEYLDNGVRLGWLIDPFNKRVYVYRPGKMAECLENPASISGDPVLPGFLFNVAEIW
jgi:Uma2 family endonuclease